MHTLPHQMPILLEGDEHTLGNTLQAVFFADGKKPKFSNTHYK